MLLMVDFLQIRKLTEDTGQEEKRKEMLETRITVSSCHILLLDAIKMLRIGIH